MVGDNYSLPAEELQARLVPITSDFVGAPVIISQLQQLTAGAAAQTWRFDAAYGDVTESLILRRGVDADQFAGALGKADEARVIDAARRSGVRAPQILGVLTPDHNLGEGFVMSCIEGETLPQRILRDVRFSDARAQLATQCAQALAAIHATPLDDLSHLPVNDAAAQIDFYEQAFRQFDQALPVFELAFQCLRQHSVAAELALVHGDFRNGNIIVGEDGLRAVLDWELAHIGDPMEDLGWLCVNSWRFGERDKPVGGFGQRRQLYEAYTAASGRAVKPERVAFWELFGTLKWGVICLYQCHAHLSGAQRSHERAAIGRRVSECELDMLALIEEEFCHE